MHGADRGADSGPPLPPLLSPSGTQVPLSADTFSLNYTYH
jgi:hypothetical protein